MEEETKEVVRYVLWMGFNLIFVALKAEEKAMNQDLQENSTEVKGNEIENYLVSLVWNTVILNTLNLVW